ncbi:MAG: HAMP domain-containing histidine kinase [Polyangiaceae bacterium]|nr:HAMP domain-containing histidine kinase [Polyangiaceae bacterium]
MTRQRSPSVAQAAGRGRGLSLAAVATAAVLLLGIAVTTVMVALSLAHFRRVADEGSEQAARLLARTTAARLRAVGEEDRPQVLEHIARQARVDLLLVEGEGRVLVDTGAELERPASELLLSPGGFTDTSTGRSAFSAQSLSPPQAHLSVVALVHAPATPLGSRDLLRALVVLAVALVATASYGAFRFAKGASDDLEVVRARVERMARAPGEPVGEPVPIRTFEQGGVVAAAFDLLLERFAASERAHRQDLEQAEAIDEGRSRFLATLSHELRTPLNGILGFTDVLSAEVEGEISDGAREDLAVIRKSGEHLRGLIDDILDLSAIETGTLRLDRALIDLSPIVDDVLRSMAPLLEGRPVRLVAVGDRPTLAWADRRRVHQILTNLIGNAVKFTAAGEVRVTLRSGDQRARVSVSDSGPGISEAEAQLVFEEFRQVGDARLRRKGSGLGLAIARRLTLAHSGSLALDSVPGEGSTFHLELPAAPLAETSEPPARRSSPPAPGSRPPVSRPPVSRPPGRSRLA